MSSRGIESQMDMASPRLYTAGSKGFERIVHGTLDTALLNFVV